MKRVVLVAALCGLCFFFGSWEQTAKAANVTFSMGAVGKEVETIQRAVNEWSQKTGHTVKLVTAPNASNDRLALYQQNLAAKSAEIDVYQIDVIWPGILGNHLLDLTPYVKAEDLAQHFPTLIENDRVNNRLVALPWFTDAGVLFYRKDLLEKYGRIVPQTWQELEETATLIQQKEREAGNVQFWGLVFQAKSYEGLTCNALEWVDSFKGGTIFDAKGQPRVNTPEAAKALMTVAGWIGKIAPIGVLSYAEEESRGVFQSGNALFMRNWPYAWSLGNSADSPIKDKIGVAALPKGGESGKNTGTLGGWHLAVSNYSKNKDIAADLVKFLTRPEEQKHRAIEASLNPTIVALYEDKEVLAANPFFGSLFATFQNAVARPSRMTGENYNRVSQEFYTKVHTILSKKLEAAKELESLEKTLIRITKSTAKKN